MDASVPREEDLHIDTPIVLPWLSTISTCEVHLVSLEKQSYLLSTPPVPEESDNNTDYNMDDIFTHL